MLNASLRSWIAELQDLQKRLGSYIAKSGDLQVDTPNDAAQPSRQDSSASGKDVSKTPSAAPGSAVSQIWSKARDAARSAGGAVQNAIQQLAAQVPAAQAAVQNAMKQLQDHKAFLESMHGEPGEALGAEQAAFESKQREYQAGLASMADAEGEDFLKLLNVNPPPAARHSAPSKSPSLSSTTLSDAARRVLNDPAFFESMHGEPGEALGATQAALESERKALAAVRAELEDLKRAPSPTSPSSAVAPSGAPSGAGPTSMVPVGPPSAPVVGPAAASVASGIGPSPAPAGTATSTGTVHGATGPVPPLSPTPGDEIIMDDRLQPYAKHTIDVRNYQNAYTQLSEHLKSKVPDISGSDIARALFVAQQLRGPNAVELTQTLGLDGTGTRVIAAAGRVHVLEDVSGKDTSYWANVRVAKPSAELRNLLGLGSAFQYGSNLAGTPVSPWAMGMFNPYMMMGPMGPMMGPMGPMMGPMGPMDPMMYMMMMGMPGMFNPMMPPAFSPFM